VDFSMIALLLFAGLLLAMLAVAEIGRRIGAARLLRDPDGLAKGVGAVEAAVFALLGLLLAFSFSGAASRFEDRRHLITAETNAIGTAYLRVDLLPADARPEMRDLFRRYVDSRLETYRNPQDRAATQASLAENAAIQGQIWTRAVKESLRPEAPTQAAMLLLPALNEMIDIATTRVMATRNHPPPVIFLLLVGISLVGALLVGYGVSINKGRSWLHMLVFAFVLSLTTYLIIDLEFPRLGFIRVDAADNALVELRASMR
jgi:hypothetical protein